MHHCFRIAEILTMIMNYLVDGARGAREVLALMKTCKVLYEPSLDILWRDLDCLAPLVMCLSQDVWKVRNKLLVGILSRAFRLYSSIFPLFSVLREHQVLKNRRDSCFTRNVLEVLGSNIGRSGHSIGSCCDCIVIRQTSYYLFYHTCARHLYI